MNDIIMYPFTADFYYPTVEEINALEQAEFKKNTGKNS